MLLPLGVNPRKVNGTFAFAKANDWRDRLLRRHRDQPVNMIGHPLPRFDPALLLPGEVVKHGSPILPQLPIKDTAATLGDKDNMLFARPT
jgi:hypothetical protein